MPEGPRKVIRPSASSLARALSCEASSVLPRSPPGEDSAAAARGTRIHYAIEKYLDGARAEDIKHQMLPADCADFDEVVANLPKIEPIPGLPFTEFEAWLDPLTQHALLGTPGVTPPTGYLRGRSDAIGVYDHPTVGKVKCVCDWKTGNPRFQADSNSAQLGFFALWLHCFTGDSIVGTVIYRTQDKHKPVHIWDPRQLERFGDQLAAMSARLDMLELDATLEPQIAKSKECHFCPAKAGCPLWQKGGGDALQGP